MVNTFVLNNPENGDFRETAQKLDFKRLNKQIIESIQILDTIESYEILSQIFENPIPEEKGKLKTWTREIMKKYKNLNYYIFKHQNTYVQYYKNNKNLPEKVPYDETYSINEDGSIQYKGKKYKKYTLILPGDKFITQGYCYHPIILMYMKHKDTLKLYINSCIDVFVERGGKKGVSSRKYDLSYLYSQNVKMEHPSWCKDPKFHENHKAALLYKELERKEKPWYIHFPDFVEAYLKYFVSTDDVTPLSNAPAPYNPKAANFPFYIWNV